MGFGASTQGPPWAVFSPFFASLLHARLALYVEQVNERKLVCAWCIMEKLR
jgi:hypothetical protein